MQHMYVMYVGNKWFLYKPDTIIQLHSNPYSRMKIDVNQISTSYFIQFTFIFFTYVKITFVIYNFFLFQKIKQNGAGRRFWHNVSWFHKHNWIKIMCVCICIISSRESINGWCFSIILSMFQLIFKINWNMNSICNPVNISVLGISFAYV